MAGSNQSMMSPALFMSARRFRSTACLAALVWGAAFVGLPDGAAQRRHGPSPLDTLKEEADQTLGLNILSRYRSLGVLGEYRFRFKLKVMPRREKTQAYDGVLLGTAGETGPISRVDIATREASIDEKGNLVPAQLERLFLENGFFARAFEWEKDSGGGVVSAIPSDRYFEPIVGSDFTVFDLLAPYTFWQRFYYEGRTTFRGRPSHVFWLYPPERDALMRSKVSGVRLYLDDEFSAPIQVEVYDEKEKHVKTITVVDFKKVEGQWILGAVDVRNEVTRDKTRFQVVDADMGIDVPAEIFTPGGLSEKVFGTELSVMGAAEAN